MVTLSTLWLAILLSAVIVWIASAIIWMALPHHKSDCKGLPDEDAFFDAMRPQNLSAGVYNIPHCGSWGDIKKPEVLEKFNKGPIGFFTVLPNGVPKMGQNMLLSFVYYLVVSVIVAYIAGRTIPAGAEYLTVFRLTGTVTWVAYGMAVIPEAIWFGKPWSHAFKLQFDAIIYGLLTAGVFGWLWPR